KDRYPVIDEEQLVEYSPDVVLLSSEPFPFKKDHLKQIERLGIPAMLVDGEYFSWYGSRLKKAFDYFRSLN
ncbi:MAG: cobalamin-binding protein, partial [Zunongwangia sp.]|nr:cobalamin-binding protein [Zunongwangia sp.]